MNLIKDVWTENDMKSFETYLISIKNEEKIDSNWSIVAEAIVLSLIHI